MHEMSYLILALGILLAICGAAAISFGYGIIDVERGWANVISGAVALSGGIVTIALAMILHSLSGLRPLLKAERARKGIAKAPSQAEPPTIEAAEPQAMEQATELASALAAILPAIDEAGGALEAELPAPLAAAPTPASAPAPAAAAARAEASIEDVRRVVAQTIKHAASERRVEIGAAAPATDVETALTHPPASPSRRRPFGLPRALDLKDIAPQHFGPAKADATSALGAAPEAEQAEAAPAPRPQAAEAASSAPVHAQPARPPVEKPRGSPPRRGDDRFDVIGRYESEGTSYVMFADGSIDARSNLGAFHFSSMAELKAFMESQARGQS
jgi:hypothetical protein